METGERLDTWGIVEVMGHKKFAGRVTEHVIGGTALIRVDVPAVKDQPEFCKLIGAGSIYCITPTDEDTARKAAGALSGYSDALPVYIPPEPKQLAAAGADYEEAERVSARLAAAVASNEDGEDFDNIADDHCEFCGESESECTCSEEDATDALNDHVANTAGDIG